MGCLGRFFWCMVYFGIAITCFFIWFLLSSLTSDAQKSASVSLLTPEKKLETVLREDGPAWVKGRIESLSSGSVLYCDGHPCIWYRFERQEKREEDIRKGGTWIKRKTWKRVLSDEKGVPAVFVAGSESFPIKDWLGIEISEDLLSGSNIISSQAEKAPHENSAESPEVLNASDSDESKNSQTIGKWLPAGMEAWGFGDFKNGIPRVFLNNKFYFTGIGREEFSKRFLENFENYIKFSRIYVVGGFFFLLLSVREMFKGKPKPQ